MKMMKMFWKDEQGQDMVEYALLLGFIAMAGVASYQAISTHVKSIWSVTETQTGAAATAAT
jgi:Flp pilus assembly pilin Flp